MNSLASLGLFENHTPQGMFDFSAKSPPVYQVAELVRMADRLLDGHFERVFVEGELDSVKIHSSGHVYFTLKDPISCISAIMMRAKAQKVRFPLKNGLKVRVLGRLGIYETQGKFQIYVEELLLSGDGELQQAFEELKQKLEKEGLFAKERKRPLPRFPKRVGIATSLDGAVLRDILRVATRRGRVRFLVSPCLVQGDLAPEQICKAIASLEAHVDVIIIARGGGSSTDLWAFNDEKLARSISGCKVPIVSAVGHEVDYTISDWVADLRAPTPSAAAECVVPEFALYEAELTDLHKRLFHAAGRALDTAKQKLDHELTKHQACIQKQLSRIRQNFHTVTQRLSQQHPKTRLLHHRAALEQFTLRLRNFKQAVLENKRHQFASLVGQLNALSPLQVLSRGYAVVWDQQNHVAVSAENLQVGETIKVRLHKGELTGTITKVSSG